MNELKLTGHEIALKLIKRSCPVKSNMIIKLQFIISTMRLTDMNAADEVLWSEPLLQKSSQLNSDSINSPIDVFLGVVDVRRESHSVALLGGYPNVVVFIQRVI